MNNKGQTLGPILIVFMTLIVGLALFLVIAQQVGSISETISVENQSLDTVVNGTVQYMTNIKSISSVVIFNETNDELIGAGNYTVTNNVVNDGALAVSILPVFNTDEIASAWKVSGTAQKLDYIDNSAARSIASLIAIFFALAIAVVALTPTLRNGVLEMMGR